VFVVLSQLLFLGGNKIPRQNLSPKKSIKTQLLINIIIYSMNPIPFIHPISKTQKNFKLFQGPSPWPLHPNDVKGCRNVCALGEGTSTTVGSRLCGDVGPHRHSLDHHLHLGFSKASSSDLVSEWGHVLFFDGKVSLCFFQKKSSQLSRGGGWKRCFIHSSYWEIFWFGFVRYEGLFFQKKVML